MTIMVSLCNIAAAILAAEKLVGPLDIVPINPEQEDFKKRIEIFRKSIGKMPEVKSIAADNSAAIRKFLAENKITMDIPEFSSPRIGFASIMRILLEWTVPGKAVTIRTETTKGVVDGVLLKNGVVHRKVEDYRYPITVIETKSGDKVYITLPEKTPKDEYELALMAEKIHNHILSLDSSFDFKTFLLEYDGIGIPMLNASEMGTVKWILGMSPKKPYYIDLALQKSILMLDEFGVFIENTFAGSMTLGMTKRKEPLVIRTPYLIIIERNEEIIFAGYMTEESWARPPKTTDQLQ